MNTKIFNNLTYQKIVSCNFPEMKFYLYESKKPAKNTGFY